MSKFVILLIGPAIWLVFSAIYLIFGLKTGEAWKKSLTRLWASVTVAAVCAALFLRTVYKSWPSAPPPTSQDAEVDAATTDVGLLDSMSDFSDDAGDTSSDTQLQPAPNCSEETASIPAGYFVAGIGSDAGVPKSLVHVGAFCIDRNKVTLADYRDCVKAGRCAKAASVFWAGISPKQRSELSDYCVDSGSWYVSKILSPASDLGKYPINCVDWAGADAYCRWKSKRLPTRDEFEWVARNATADTTYPWGEEQPGMTDDPERLCWELKPPTRACPCPVGAFPLGATKAWGVMDLSGNLMEWTADQGVINPNTHVVRGSKCTSTDWRVVRSWYRPWPPGADEVDTTLRSTDIGFRCAN